MTRLALSGVTKRLAKLEQRSRLLDVSPLVMIDGVGLFDDEQWRAYLDGDAATREAMRREYDAQIEALVAAANLAPPSHPLAITAIEVRTYLPDEGDVWRYVRDEAEDPTPATPRQRTPQEQAKLDHYRETGEWSDEPTVAVEVDPRDAEPEGDPTEILYYDHPSMYPVTRREHQIRRAREREARKHAAAQRAHIEATGKE